MNVTRHKSEAGASPRLSDSYINQASMPAAAEAHDQLLERYMALSEEQRKEEFFDTESAAATAGLSRRTIQYWADIGAVEAVFIGRKWWISVESLRDYIKRQANGHGGQVR